MRFFPGSCPATGPERTEAETTCARVTNNRVLRASLCFDSLLPGLAASVLHSVPGRPGASGRPPQLHWPCASLIEASKPAYFSSTSGFAADPTSSEIGRRLASDLVHLCFWIALDREVVILLQGCEMIRVGRRETQAAASLIILPFGESGPQSGLSLDNVMQQAM